MPSMTSVQTEERHQRTLESMQLEALNPRRIEPLKTSEYREKRQDYVPSAYIQRRVDEDGTEENRAAQGEGRQKMAAWNTAWMALQDDGTAPEDLRDVNEGLGQTHRGKLQADDSIRDYKGEEFNYRGGHRGGRGVHYGGRGTFGRGGGFAGHRQGEGRQAATECPVPSKRIRVLKGSSLKPVSSVQCSMKPEMALEIQSATRASPRRSTSTLKQRPAGPTTFLPQATARSSEVSDPGPSKKAVNFHGNLATPDAFMASILPKERPAAAVPNTSKPQVGGTAASEVATTASGSDVKREAITIADRPNVTKQPSEDVLLGAVAHANVTQTPKPQPRDATFKTAVSRLNNTIPVVLNPPQLDLLDVDIGGEGPRQSVIEFTRLPTPKESPLLKNIEELQASGGLSTEQLELLQTLKIQVQSQAGEQTSQPMKLDAKPTVAQTVATPSGKADPCESIAQRLVAQRAIIIGEHVHRTRFQHSALIEKFSNLQISEKTSSRLAKAKADGLSTTNPFGPAKPAASQKSGAGPSLPVHLAHLSPVTDPGAAVRTQYDPSNASSSDRAATKVRTGPSLPDHLAHVSPVTDSGAAVRAQYDPSNASSSDRGATKFHTAPSLPAHLASVHPATDAGAATRASYTSTGVTSRGRGILNSVSNGQLRSFPSPDSATSAPSSLPAPRVSMLNKTGFIGLAENRAQAKKSDDPLLVARKRGI